MRGNYKLQKNIKFKTTDSQFNCAQSNNFQFYQVYSFYGLLAKATWLEIRRFYYNLFKCYSSLPRHVRHIEKLRALAVGEQFPY